ncbi:TPA: Cro/Cl family transcriptional regulator [Enterococcus faecalis]|nr:Cro/Cl family transcriptional regulator [Enterococcus faecalis]HAP3811142.1 Cro/Cl family transcriptional regulator [Enterococcus faecalis]
MDKENREFKVELLINDLLAERSMSLRELASLSRIESFNQSNLAVGKRKKIYLEHIGRIVYASEIENISEIIAIKSISSNYREGNFNEY